MPSFLPTKIHKTAGYPACVDLRELFEGEVYKTSLNRVINHLHNVYVNFSDGSFERISRPDIVTEQFFLTMPTVDAAIAEIELCNAIASHALGNIKDENIKIYLQKYLDSHCFVYQEINGRVRQSFKVGTGKRTGRDVQLYALDNGKCDSGGVFNAIQAYLFKRLEIRSGNNAEYRIVRL